MNKAVLATVMAVGLVGCVGGIDSTNPGDDQPGNTARELFDNTVHPLLARCASCHTHGSESGNVTGFYTSDLSTAYTTATGYVAFVGDYTPQSAPVLTKILPNNHNNMHWSDAEVQTITTWLNQELTERGGGTTTTTTPESEAQAMLRLKNNWSSCMTLTDFQTAQMATQFGQMRADNPNNQCQQCHNLGYEGFIATVDESYYYQTLSQHSRYMLQYFAFDLTNGAQNAKIIVNTTSFMAVSQAMPPHTQHPEFDALNNQGMTALKAWYDLIQAKVMAAPNGSCGATQLVD